MSSSLFQNLDAGAVLVTQLPKQAEQFRLAFAKWKKSQGINAWSSPNVVSWPEWLKRMGEDLLWSGYSGKQGVRSLLTPLQEQIVWEQVIKAEINQPLLHLPSTATLARQAWGLMQSWRMPDPSAAQFPSDDVISYTKWISNYYKRCKNAAWLDHARLPDTLKRAISKEKVKLPDQLILAGFIQLSPQQFELVSAIKELGLTDVSLYKSDKRLSSIEGKSYTSTLAEFYDIAFWCKSQIEKNPNVNIGVAIPGLAQKRTEFDYILRKVLYPSSFSSKDEFINAAYQFSVGESLANSELANMALSLLELIEGQFKLDQISQIIRSPFCFGGRAEYTERLKIDAWLRKKGLIEFNLSTLIELLAFYQKQKADGSKATLFEVSLMTLRTTFGIAKNTYSPSIWAKHFSSCLDKFGWPNATLSPTEHRHAEAFRSCLNEFASIDFVQHEMNFSLAISSLRRIVQNKRLSVVQVFAPIQVLDLNEVHGLDFDYLWVAQLSDQVLPESSQTNPLIPYAWQCVREMSGATPEIRLKEANQRVAHIRQAADHIVFSYATEENVDQQQAPAMLRDINFVAQEVELPALVKKYEVEWLTELHGPEYLDNKTVGTSIFKFQAECPFKAFARTRLLASNIEKATYGLTAMERGNLLHSTLELVWLRIGASDTLAVAMQSEHLEMQIWEIVDKVISHYETKLKYRLSQSLKSLEQTRLVKLTMAWLELEKERAPFELHRSEFDTEVEINGLTVKCRVDRVDEINDIGFAIIDYKSGAESASAWFGPRPDQPQMPIYALAEQNKVVAIVYANLKPGESGFTGVSRSSDYFPALNAFDQLGKNQRRGLSWDDLIPYWRENLNNLAHDYKIGIAIPDPKKGIATCRYCELETLCRVNGTTNAHSNLYKDGHV